MRLAFLERVDLRVVAADWTSSLPKSSSSLAVRTFRELAFFGLNGRVSCFLAFSPAVRVVLRRGTSLVSESTYASSSSPPSDYTGVAPMNCDRSFSSRSGMQSRFLVRDVLRSSLCARRKLIARV